MNSFFSRKLDLFYKLAAGVGLKLDVLKNKDPILLELNDIKNYTDRVAFLEEKFNKLGEGSSRAVFDIGDDIIIKLATNEKGLAQNLEESRICAQRECTNKVILAEPEGKWNIMHKIKKIDKKDFAKLTGIEFDDFTASLYYRLNAESDYKKPKAYEEVIENEFFKCVADLILDVNLQIGDLRKLNSFGELNGKVVISDYGLSRDVFNEYYDD